MRGTNKVILVGRLGADAEIHHSQDGRKIASLRLATDEGYRDRNSGEWIDRAEWHRIVTFQEGLVEVLEKHAKKGRLTLVEGKLRTRGYRKDGEDTDRHVTEILIAPGGEVQFLEPLADGPSSPPAGAGMDADDGTAEEMPFED